MTNKEAVAKLQAAGDIAIAAGCELAKIPTMDVLAIADLLTEQEQKAEWHLSRPHHFRCSGCGAQWGQAVIGMRYCPTCGRKMTLSAEERRREWPEEVSGDD